MIVKLAFEISKKMLPTQVMRMRAWVVGVLGRVTDCVPSLGVEARKKRDGTISVKGEKFWSLRKIAAVPSHDFR